MQLKNNQLVGGKKHDKTKSIVYLKERLDKLYPNYFNSKGITLLEKHRNL